MSLFENRILNFKTVLLKLKLKSVLTNIKHFTHKYNLYIITLY